MSQACLEAVENSWFRLTGEVNFASVPELLRDSRTLFRQAERLDIDLSGIERADSAGLALLVEWMRLAEQLRKPIQFLNITTQMLDIARVSGLDHVLPLARG